VRRAAGLTWSFTRSGSVLDAELAGAGSSAARGWHDAELTLRGCVYFVLDPKLAGAWSSAARGQPDAELTRSGCVLDAELAGEGGGGS
jgi:hypothetical protein